MSNDWLVAPLPINYSRLNEGFTKIEGQLASLGAIPIVLCQVAGLTRIVLGIAQIIMALALAFFNMLRGLFVSEAEKQFLNWDASRVLPYAWHGIANGFRACFELIPGLNLVTIFYDRLLLVRMEYAKTVKKRPPGSVTSSQ